MTDSLFSELKRRNVLKVVTGYVLLGWVVLQIADVIVPALSLPDWTITMLLVIGVLGLPFVVFFSWAFEITPEGIKREHEVDRAQSVTDQTGRKIDFIIIGLLAVALSYFIYESRIKTSSNEVVYTQDSNEALAPSTVDEQQPSNGLLDSSIAVLPFQNMSSDPEQEYFSDGISEELLNLLAKIPDLKVAARTSSFQFKGKNQDIQDIAQQLGVKTVLEGSVRKSGTKVRITAQLIKADDGFHMWSETYDRELDDIFAVQDEISAAIVESLKQSLGIELTARKSEKSRVNPRAYDYYLKGLRGINVSTFESLAEAQQYLQDAVNLEPDFQEAQVALADSIFSQFFTGSVGDRNTLDQAIGIIDNVLSKHPSNADALYLKSNILRSQNKGDLAAEAFRQAYAIEPHNSKTLQTYSSFSFGDAHRLEYPEEQLRESFDYLISVDPLNFDHYYSWGIINQWRFAKYDVAEKMYLRATELEPANGNPPFFLANLKSYNLGDLYGSIEIYEMVEDLDPSDPDSSIFLSMIYLTLGSLDRSVEAVERALLLMPNSGQALDMKAATLMYQQKYDDAFQLINLTLNNSEVFYRRGARRNLVEKGIYIFLLRNEADKARDFLFQHYPNTKDLIDAPAPESRDEVGFRTPAYATIERAAGNEENAQKLISRWKFMTDEEFLKGKIKPAPFDYINMLYARTLEDKQDEAFELLEKLFDDKGYLTRYIQIEWNPVFMKLKEDPRYQTIMTEVEQEMSRQRQFLK